MSQKIPFNGFVQRGAGAILRAQSAKLRERVDVSDYGARGDGVTDDTASILAAIAALPNGGTVNFGPGVFVATLFTVSTSGIHLVGAGVNATTLKLKDGQNTSFIQFFDVNGGEVAKLTIDGNRANQTAGTDKVALLGARCRNVVFRDLHVKDVYGKGLGFDGGPVGHETMDNRASSFSVTNCKEQAVIVDGSSGANMRTVIADFTIYDTGHAGVAINDGASDVTVSSGIIDSKNSTWDAVAIRNAKRVTLSNVTGMHARNGLYVQYSLAPCEDIVVSNCIWVGNTQNGVLIISAKRVKVHNNIAKNNNQGAIVGNSGFVVTKDAQGVESEYVTFSTCMAIDDQATPTQDYGFSFQASPLKTTLVACDAKGNKNGVCSVGAQVATAELIIMPGGGIDMRGTLKWASTAASGNLISFQRIGENFERFAISEAGVVQWGAGAAALDINLYRFGVNMLKTDDKLLAAGGFGVGQSASGISAQVGVPSGNTSNKLAIYDSNNTLMGYIPIYTNPW
jgi:hypothetical protein